MKKPFSGLLAAALAASFCVAVAPAEAAPLPLLPLQARQVAPDAAAPFEKVEYKKHKKYRKRPHHNDRPHYHNGKRPHHHHRPNYWNGHYGEHHWRPGYRRHGDYWFPLAAFATGALIGTAIANDAPPPPPAYRGESAHVRWCYERYRSYRAYDNTYQPYEGPRRQCVSPY